MKKIIFKPKFFILSFLFLGILAILAEVTTVALAQMSFSAGKLTHSGTIYSRTYSGDINLLHIGINNNTCFQNNDPNNDYFIPYNSSNEWIAVYSAIVGGRVPNVTTVNCCNQSPNNIYYNAGYFTNHQCGQTYPGCYLADNYGYNVVNDGSVGAVCWSGNWRSTKCGTLLKATSICNGDPCVNGIDASDINNPQFCVGVYDSLSKVCTYQARVPISVSNNTTRYYPANTPYGSQTDGSWGSCSTQPVCGNGICEAGYGENCSRCSSDCGACPPDCSAYPKSSMCDATPGCMWTVQGCVDGGINY